MQRRVEEGPMTHIANTEDPHVAWQTLQMMYKTINDAATPLMCQQFYGKLMAEGSSLEEYIKTMRRAQEKINLMVTTQGGSCITEVEFIQRLATSLPDSWDILKSVMDYTVQSTDIGGIAMSNCIQNQLLAEDLCHCAKGGNKSFYAEQPNNSPRNFQQDPSNQGHAFDKASIICNNSHKTGHIKHKCRGPRGCIETGESIYRQQWKPRMQ
jgi:hypothetical protein